MTEAGLMQLEPEKKQQTKALRPSKVLLFALLIVILGAAVRLGTIRREDLGVDEYFSQEVALMPVHSAMAAIRYDLVHPPLYYLLLKAGTSLWGAGPLGVRIISIIFGLAILALACYIGAELVGAPYAGLLAASLLAVNATMVFFSQQARSYSLYTVLVLLLLIWLIEAFETRWQLWRLWISGSLLMAVLVYTHYVGALYIASAVVAVLISRTPLRSRVVVVSAALAAALSFIPWLVAIAGPYHAKHGLSTNLGWMSPPSLGELLQVWSVALGPGNLRRGALPALCIALVLFFYAFTTPEEQRNGRRSAIVSTLALFAVLPPIVMFILSSRPVNLPIFMGRHLLPSTVCLCLLCCIGLDNMARRWRRYYLVFYAGAALLMFFTAMPTYGSFGRGHTWRYPWHVIAGNLLLEERAGNAIFTSDPEIEVPVDFYCKSSCIQLLPQQAASLPDRFVYVFQPNGRLGSVGYRELLKSGFLAETCLNFGGGEEKAFDAWVVHLSRKRDDVHDSAGDTCSLPGGFASEIGAPSR